MTRHGATVGELRRGARKLLDMLDAEKDETVLNGFPDPFKPPGSGFFLADLDDEDVLSLAEWLVVVAGYEDEDDARPDASESSPEQPSERDLHFQQVAKELAAQAHAYDHNLVALIEGHHANNGWHKKSVINYARKIVDAGRLLTPGIRAKFEKMIVGYFGFMALDEFRKEHGREGPPEWRRT